MSTIEIREKLAVVQIASDVWSGQTTLEGTDIRIGAGGELPSQELARLGFKWLVDRKTLRPLRNIYNQMRTVCEKHGLPFLGGYAIPHNKELIEHVSKDLDQLVLLGLTRKAEWINSYDKFCEEWACNNPEYQNILRAAKVPLFVVDRKINFGYRIYSVQPVNSSETAKIDKIAQNLGNELMDELVDEAIAFLSRAVSEKDAIQSTTRKTFNRIHGKLKGLSFLDPKFDKVVEMLDETLRGYIGAPKEIVGEQYFRVVAAGQILASRDMIARLADGSITLNGVMSNLRAGLGIHGYLPTSTTPILTTATPALELEPTSSSTFF